MLTVECERGASNLCQLFLFLSLPFSILSDSFTFLSLEVVLSKIKKNKKYLTRSEKNNLQHIHIHLITSTLFFQSG